MSEDLVVESTDAGVVTLRLNRPEARNALNGAAIAALTDALDRAAADESARVVVLTGTGSTFSAGADVKSALAGDESGFAASGPEAFGSLLAAIADCPVPTIARVQGNVFGGGNGLVAACDLAVAAAETKFAFSEVRLGLTPAVISVFCLPKLSKSAAAELLLLGDRVPAAKVAESGMITAVVAADQLDEQVADWCQRLQLGGPQALAGTKQLLRQVPEMDRTAGLGFTAEFSGQFFRSAEAQEGMAALLQKRRPAWAPQSS